MDQTNDAALMALAFVEAVILEDGHKVQALARATKPGELAEMFSTVSKMLAALLEGSLGVTGAIEKIHLWRGYYLGTEEPQWSE